MQYVPALFFSARYRSAHRPLLTFALVTFALAICLCAHSSALGSESAQRSQSTSKLRVAIDPGHGGARDPGAIYSNIKEADLVLQVGRALHRRLMKSTSIESILIRDSDESLKLEDRTARALAGGAQLLVSLHANAAPNPQARGLELYLQNSLSSDAESLRLAALENKAQKRSDDQRFNQGIIERVRSLTSRPEAASSPPTAQEGSPVPPATSLAGSKPNPWRAPMHGSATVTAILDDLYAGARQEESFAVSKAFLQQWPKGEGRILQAPFFVLTQSKVPAVLVELGFLSNPKEAERLRQPKYQQLLVERLARALEKYSAGLTPQKPRDNESDQALLHPDKTQASQ